MNKVRLVVQWVAILSAVALREGRSQLPPVVAQPRTPAMQAEQDGKDLHYYQAQLDMLSTFDAAYSNVPGCATTWATPVSMADFIHRRREEVRREMDRLK